MILGYFFSWGNRILILWESFALPLIMPLKIGAVVAFWYSSYNKPFLTFEFLLRSLAFEDKE